MGKIEFEARGRSMRWYEWLSLLFLLGIVCGVREESVYKCTDGQGAIAYQAQPCPLQHMETTVTIAPAPAHVVAPEYALDEPPPDERSFDRRAPDTRRTPRARNAMPTRRSAERLVQSSYECRVSDGEVFYRHTPCPHSLSEAGSTRSGKGRDSRGSQKLTQKLTVTARQVSREEACGQIHRPGAIGRAGREHDEDVSTYERNLGNDPCK